MAHGTLETFERILGTAGIILFWAHLAVMNISRQNDTKEIELFRYDHSFGTCLKLGKPWTALYKDILVSNGQRPDHNYHLSHYDGYNSSSLKLNRCVLNIQATSAVRNNLLRHEQRQSVTAIHTQKDFEFQYGEVTWSAIIIGSNRIRNIFRIGEWNLKMLVPLTPKSLNSLDEPQRKPYMIGDSPGTEFAIQTGPDGTQLSAIISDGRSTDNSYDLNSLWMSSNCRGCTQDLTKTVIEIQLRWKRDEVVWLLDGQELFRFANATLIPQTKLPIFIAVAADRDLYGNEQASLYVFSVVVRQNVSRINSNFTDMFEETFSVDGKVDKRNWQTFDGEVNADNPNTTSSGVYDSTFTRVRGGLLEVLTGRHLTDPTLTSCTTGHMDGLPPMLSLQYGEVEWRAKFHPVIPHARYLLELKEAECQQSGPEHVNCNDQYDSVRIGFMVYFTDSTEVRDAWISTAHINPHVCFHNHNPPLNGTFATPDDKFRNFKLVWTKSYITWHIDDHEVFSFSESMKMPRESSSLHVSISTEFCGSYICPALRSLSAVGMEVERVIVRKERSYAKATNATTVAPSPNGNTSAFPLNSSSTLSTVFSTETVNLSPTAAYPDGYASTTTKVLITVAVVVLVTVAIFVSMIWMRRKRKMRGTMRTSSTEMTVHLRDQKFVSQREALRMSSLIGRYVNLLAVPPRKVDINYKKVLGKGEFGIVYMGVAHSLPALSKGRTRVAAKCLINPLDQAQQNMFDEEVKIMAKLGKHPNVVSLLGIVMQGSSSPALLLEFCQHGSLLSYLRTHKRSRAIYTHVDDNGTLLPFSQDDQEEIQLTLSGGGTSTDVQHVLSTNDLIRFSHQISRGMEHLISRSIIHRDLAARNILVADHNIIKISDFGLAKHGYVSYTISSGSVALPVLSMSPEAITEKVFSQKSDVWSFGIVLWEIFSLGNIPFNGPEVPKISAAAFCAWLMEGHHLEQMSGTPVQLYEIMQHCWSLDPKDRPTFSTIENTLRPLVHSSMEYLLVIGEEDDVVVQLQNEIFSLAESSV